MSVRRAGQEELPDGDDDTYVCLEVADTGVGMSRKTAARIFEPFYTTKSKGEHRGTGLGLSITASVVEQHNGRIEVDTELGRGTCFRVYFPALEEELAARPKTDDLATGTGRILFVDDEQVVNEVAALLFRKLGYEATCFTDPREALQVFLEEPSRYQLVVTDYAMPHLTGEELMAAIREVRKDLPILLVTGYRNLATPQNMAKWGCNGILAKPFDIKEISWELRRLTAGEEQSPRTS